MEFIEGARFDCHAVFLKRLKEYEKKTYTQFSLVGAEKVNDGDPLFERFRYRVLRYQCKQGHRTKERSSKNERPVQRSYKVGCPVQLNVRLNQPKGKEPFLKVTKLINQHSGHDVSEENFNLYPEQRRIDVDEVDHTVLSSVTMKLSEQRDILEQRHAGCLLRQDVYNLQKRLGVGNGNGGDDHSKCENIIRDLVASGGIGEVGKNESGEFLFVCFMTSSMKNILIKYPECLVLDCTYKVNNYLYPLLTIMVIDGEGHGMPVFHAFLAKEDRHIMESCLRIFAQQFNPGDARCFIVDKDMAEIAAIGSVFPDVPINLCQFHISQAVERFLRKELGRGTSGSKVVLDSFMTQVTSESEEEFEEMIRKISDIVPQSVKDYFMENWWSKRQLWAACCNTNIIKLHATTTNTLESYHGKIKKVMNEKLCLSTALSSLISFDNSKISEQERLKIVKSNSVVYDHRDQDVVSQRITSSLTRFGAELVKHELLLSRKVSYSVSEGQDCSIVSYRDKEHSTSSTTCSCSTYGHFQVPCRHIFFLRCHLDLDPFDVVLVPERFRKAQVIPESPPHPSVGDFSISTVSSAPLALHTVEGRFNRAKVLCDKAARFLSILGVSEFQHKLQELEEFLDRWFCGQSHSVRSVPVVDVIILPSHDDSVPGSSSPPAPNPVEPVLDIVGPSSGGFIDPLPDPLSSVDPLPVSESISSSPVSVSSHPVLVSNSVEVSDTVTVPGCVELVDVPLSQVVDSVDPSSACFINPLPNTLSSVDPLPVSESSTFAPESVSSHPVLVSNFVSDSVEVGPTSDRLSPDDLSVVSGPSDDPASSAVTTSWPKMSRLLKPRGRPGNKQRFTLKRRRQIPNSFSSLSLNERINVLLRAVTIHSRKPQGLIPVHDIKPLADFTDTVLDERVDMFILKDLFELSAWEYLKGCLEDRVSAQMYSCGECRDVDDGELKMVQCEHCLIWFHFECVGYSSKKKVTKWFCEACM